MWKLFLCAGSLRNDPPVTPAPKQCIPDATTNETVPVSFRTRTHAPPKNAMAHVSALSACFRSAGGWVRKPFRTAETFPHFPKLRNFSVTVRPFARGCGGNPTDESCALRCCTRPCSRIPRAPHQLRYSNYQSFRIFPHCGNSHRWGHFTRWMTTVRCTTDLALA